MDMPVAHSSAANTAASLEPRRFGTWSGHASSLHQQNCKGGYATTRQIRRNQSFNRSQYSLGSLTQGPEVGESVRSVKYSFARPCLTRGSRSVPMYSARKSRSPSTFGVSRDEPEKSAHKVIGSGFHSGRIGTSLAALFGCFAIHSGSILDGAGRGNRTPMELLPTDFEFPMNTVSL